MKKILCLTIVLLSALSLFAQEKTIDKAEFDAALKYRFVKYAGQSYRETMNAENIQPAPNTGKSTLKTVLEIVPRVGMRSLFEYDSPSLKSREETIRIDEKIYSRKNGGEWTVKNRAETSEPKPARESKFKTVEERTEYKSLGTGTLNNLSTNIYAKIETKKSVDEENRKEMITTITTKYWLDQDGGIMKEETLLVNQFKSPVSITSPIYQNLRTRIWEFDPNIKIEAPVITK